MDISSYSSTSTSATYAQMRQSMFSSIDTDSSGEVSLEEFTAAKPADAPTDGPDSSELFAQFDTDGSGSLSQSEMEQAASQQPPPPPGGASLMSNDTLTQLLEALQESDDSETDEDTLASLLNTENDSDSEESAAIDDEVLETIQQTIEAYTAASSAYNNAQNISASALAQQQAASMMKA